jgi:2-deoxy-D-gluconate 3-dehydrogenase
MDAIADARIVLIGEASHGTHEFYRERAQLTKRLIEEKGFSAVAVEADFPDAYRLNRYVRGQGADADAVEAMFAALKERWGGVDILVNNAGVTHDGFLMMLAEAAWDAVIATHLTGSFLCAKHAARAMASGGRGGKIINIGSMYSIFGAPRFADYAAAKTGILGLTRSLAVELAPARIQVNAILPGWYETEMTRGLPAKPMGEQIRRRTPARRWGLPEDLVGTAVYLASPASDFVTGICIPVDGGYHVADRIMDD